MTYEIYRYIFIGAALLSGIMLAVSFVLFFVLRIPYVIGDLSGRTAKKAIADIRKQNMSANSDNDKTGKFTDKISESNETTLLNADNETTLLRTANETTVLNTAFDGYVNVELDITFIHSNEIID